MVDGEWVQEEIVVVDQNDDNEFQKIKKEYERRQQTFHNFFTVFLGPTHSSGLTLTQQHKHDRRSGDKGARHDWKHMKRGGKK